jgi:hypothetical protein
MRNRYVFLGPEVFEGRAQRSQALAIELSKRGHRVYFPSNLTDESSLKQWRIEFFRSDLSHSVINSQIVQFSFKSFEELSTDDVIIVMHPNWDVQESCRARIHYDLMDRWWEFQNSDFGLCTSRHQYWLHRANSVSVSSTELLQDCNLRKDVEVIWNATFPIDSRHLTRTKLPVKLRFIYVGAITYWLDFPLLVRLAKILAIFNGELVIVGQIEDPRICTLLAYESVILTGELDHHLAMKEMELAQVGLIPFIKSDLTEAVDPVKGYEYLENGLNVLGSRMKSINPELQNKISSASLPHIFLQIFLFKLRVLFGVTKRSTLLPKGNYWEQRSYELCRTLGIP